MRFLAATALLLTAPVLAAPLPAPDTMEHLADDTLGDAVERLHVAAGRPAGKAIPEALEAGAYHSAAALIAEAVTTEEEARLWEISQSASDPHDRYRHLVLNETKQAEAVLLDGLERLEDGTDGRVAAKEAARLIAAAELLVQAESDLMTATRFLGTALGPDDLSHPVQRYTVLLPSVKARVHAEAAHVVLDGTGAAGGADIDTAALGSAIQAHGGSGDHWIVDDFGAFHDLARHLRLYAISRPNATADDLQSSIAELDERFTPAGPAAAALAAARLDGAWWLQRLDEQEDVSETWTPVLSFLNGRSQAALYGQELLRQADGDAGSATHWWWVGALGALAALTIAIAAIWRRRSGSAVLLVAFLALAAVGAPVDAHGDPDGDEGSGDDGSGGDGGDDGGGEAPVVPLPEEPVSYARPAKGGVGNLAHGADGTLHFVWSGCQEGTPSAGCKDVFHRSLDTAGGDWSEIRLVADAEVNTSIARVAVSGAEVHIAWLEGEGDDTSQPRELHHCLLRDAPCHEPSRLSAAGVFTGGMDLASDGERALVVWSEEHDVGQMYARWWSGGEWGPPLALSDPDRLARYPSVAVDSEGVGHVAWQAGLKEIYATPTSRVLEYVRVEPGGAVGAVQQPALMQVDFNLRPDIAVNASDGVGIALNAERDVFLVEREAGATGWSDPANVSRTDAGGQAWPALTDAGAGWTVSWITGTVDTFRMWEARQAGGFWMRPQVLVSDPYDKLMVMADAVAVDDRLHRVWTGTTPNATEPLDYEMLYLAWPSHHDDVEPPTIEESVPADGAWVGGPRVTLRADVLASAPLSPQDTHWELDGQPVETTVTAEGRVVAKPAVADGGHDAKLVVRDRAGNHVERSIHFHVDSVEPAFSLEAWVGGSPVGDVAGWHGGPLSLSAVAHQDDGAPVRVQMDHSDRGTWSDVDDGESIDIPEDRWFTVRFRAIDAAGNVGLGPRFGLGWDATPPDLLLHLPRWSDGQARDLDITGSDDGSPVEVSLEWMSTEHPDDVAPDDVSRVVTTFPEVPRLPALPEGEYTLKVVAEDAAGNVQHLGGGTLGVDPHAPRAALVDGLLVVNDTGPSGLADVRLTPEGGDPVSFMFDGERASTIEVADLAETLTAGTARVVVHDRAGNLWRGTLDLVAGTVTEEPAGKSDESDGALASAATDGADNALDRRDSPGLPPAVLVAALLWGLIRRWRT